MGPEEEEDFPFWDLAFWDEKDNQHCPTVHMTPVLTQLLLACKTDIFLLVVGNLDAFSGGGGGGISGGSSSDGDGGDFTRDLDGSKFVLRAL